MPRRGGPRAARGSRLGSSMFPSWMFLSVCPSLSRSLPRKVHGRIKNQSNEQTNEHRTQDLSILRPRCRSPQDTADSADTAALGPGARGSRKAHAGPARLPAARDAAPSPVPQRPRDTGSPDLRGHAHRPGPRSPGAGPGCPAGLSRAGGRGGTGTQGRPRSGDSLTPRREAPRGLWTPSRSPGAATAAQAGQTAQRSPASRGLGGSGCRQTPSPTVPVGPLSLSFPVWRTG